MSWLKTALSEKGRIRHNMLRYRKLTKKLDAIKRILFATQSNAYFMVREVLEDTLVKANKDISSRLSFLIKGENGQKTVLDSPQKSAQIIEQIKLLINEKIRKEKLKLRDDNESWKL